MSELFEIEPVLSPKLAWIEKHKISTAFLPSSDDGQYWCWTGGYQCGAFLSNGAPADAFFAQAHSFDEAIVAHAKKRGLKLWNEEGAL